MMSYIDESMGSAGNLDDEFVPITQRNTYRTYSDWMPSASRLSQSSMRVKATPTNVNETYQEITNMSSDVSRHQSADLQNFRSKVMETDFELAKQYFMEYAKDIGLIEHDASHSSNKRTQQFVNMKKETQAELLNYTVDHIGFFSTWLHKYFTKMPNELLVVMCRSMVAEWIRHEDQKLILEQMRK